MSDSIVNLRILLWHFQVTRSWEFRVYRNDYWKGKLRWYNLVWFH